MFTVLGPGCTTVTRANTKNTDFVTGIWKNGAVGTFRGIRNAKAGYGGVAYSKKAIRPVGGYDGYKPLVVEIVKFMRTRKKPIADRETIEIYAFMEAADESKRLGGKPVTLAEVIAKARKAALKKLK